MIDVALALGATGTLLGLGSLLYARTQATATRRQADEAKRYNTVEINRAVVQSVLEARNMIISDERFGAEYLASNPTLAATFGTTADLKTAIRMRNVIDGFHDAWYLRRAGIVDDHHWRYWTAAMPPFARMPTVQKLFENAAARGAFEADFAEAFRNDVADGNVPDPRAKR